MELRESGVAVYSLIGVLCGVAESALRSASLREITRRLGAWSFVSPLAYSVGAFVFSRLLMSPTKGDFALLILPCLIAELGTGIAMTGSGRIQKALMGLSEAWTKVKAWIRVRGIIKCVVVTYCLIDFVILLEWTRWERDEILRSGQDIDFWYSPEQMAVLGPGLLLLCCLGLFLGKVWSCGLGVLPAMLLFKQSLDAYAFLSAEGVNMATWEAWRRYVVITGGPLPQIRTALAVVVALWSLESILSRVRARRQPAN